MTDYSHLPEWIQREIEDIERARAAARLTRLCLGAALLTLIVLATLAAAHGLL